MLVFVVMKEAKDEKKIWVFDNHEDALRCRQENGLDSHHLWGCTVGCYKFKED